MLYITYGGIASLTSTMRAVYDHIRYIDKDVNRLYPVLCIRNEWESEYDTIEDACNSVINIVSLIRWPMYLNPK